MQGLAACNGLHCFCVSRAPCTGSLLVRALRRNTQLKKQFFQTPWPKYDDPQCRSVQTFFQLFVRCLSASAQRKRNVALYFSMRCFRRVHYERNVGLNYMIRLRFCVCWYQWGGSCATRDFHIARKNLDTP